MKEYRFILSNYVKPELIKIDGHCFNSSFFTKNGKRYLLVRKQNYTYVKEQKIVNDKIQTWIHAWPFDMTGYTSQIVYEFDNNEWKYIKTISSATIEDMKKYFLCGEEDFRLINWNNILYASFVKSEMEYALPWQGKAFFTMHNSEINDDLEIVNRKELKTSLDAEKNWSPIEEKPFMFVYKYNPFTLLDISTMSFNEIGSIFDVQLSGSTPLIKYKGNYVCIAHAKLPNDGVSYLHYLILFDKDLNLLKMSKPFKFLGLNVEFITYIGIIDGKINILPCVNDGLTYHFVLDDDIIEDIFNDKLDNNLIDDNLYDKIFFDAVNNKNYMMACGIGTFSNNINVIHQAESLINHLHLSDYARNYLKNIYFDKIIYGI